MKPEIASVILSVFICMLMPILIGLRRWFTKRVSWQGYILLMGFVGSFFVPAICWVFGVGAPLNDSNNPVLLGTGGYYGLDYRYYGEAVFICIAIPLLAVLVTIFIPKKNGRGIEIDILQELKNKLKVDRVALLALGGSIILTVWYFSIVGWDRFWHSDMARFEFIKEERGEASLKFSLTFILAFGFLGAAMTIFRGQFLTSTLTVVIAALPFCAFASRGVTVLFIAYGVAFYYRVNAKRRWLLIVPLLIGAYLSLRLPLIMRGSGQTGLRVAITSIFQDDATGIGVTEKISSCLQNIGQGFGLLVEEREAAASGDRITDGIPMTYFLLSVSPTVSLIDGFAKNWVDYSPRCNIFTPYSGLCELVSLNWSLGLLVPVFAYLVAVLLCRNMSRISLWHETGLFAFVLIVSLGFLQMQQYSLRTATRFYYAAFAIFGMFLLLAFLARTAHAGRPIANVMRVFMRRNPKKSSSLEDSDVDD